ncbi:MULTISPECIES: CpaE family protein [unclassified Brevundimonas]|uniref:AAA family ATPase n=1 Tax=unclassified Brevundimonas TaxID=2622653 RepID=UPI000700FDB6|nr:MULTISPECIES: CpaE family protein [unclassified Brevundimonas]KQY79283.1 pilus assembly protein CpaE [Brevundimonas sp. Root1423]KRA21987.1 pilus assembly protein CpaE [Brevundimonas sp. Root608]
MSNAFAPQPFDEFDDEFDPDMGYVTPEAAAAGPGLNEPAPLPGEPPADQRPPLQFTPPAVAGPPAGPAPSLHDPDAAVPAVAGFNPVGELVAGAASAFSAPTLSGAHTAEVSVPRIAIHVFAERQDTLAAAERAGQDRRLSRATTQIRIGGVAAAVEAYQHEPTPPLIVVECMKDPQTLLWEVDQLAEVCDAGTKVVVVGATNDILLFRELMRRGVSEYLVAPLQPLQLIAAIGGLFADPAQPFVGRSIAFVGARGGTGSSSVAHNTAYAMSERIGANTVIVDYDLPFGTAGLDFNQDPLSGVADALSQPDRLDPLLLDRMMVRCTDKLSLFAAPATLDVDWDISPEAFEEVTTQIRSTAPFVVLDLPHLWSGWMRRTLIAADEVVIVATPDLASLRNAKNMIDLIKQGRPNDAPPRLVLNQVGVPGRPEIPAKDFGAALGVHPSLIIPFDPKTFGAAANNGQMILDAGAKSKAAEAFQTLAQIVSRRELPMVTGPKAKGEGRSMFSGLFKKKS